MKIGMFTDTYLPTVDGVVNSILRTKKELNELGHEVFTFAPDHPKKIEEKNTFYFRAKGFRAYPGYRMAFFPSRKKNILIKKADIDILHAHGIAFMGLKAMFSAKELEKPLILTFHTMVTEATHYIPIHLKTDFLVKMGKIYLCQFLRRCDCIIVPTKAILDDLENFCPNMKRIRVAPTGIDNSRFNPDIDGSGIRQELGLEENEIILHVGRLAREKNLELLFNAFPYVKKKKQRAKLLVVGDGPAKEYYMELAVKMNISEDVIFCGFVSDDKLPQYYACSDAFAIASKFETQGLVILEAMACGKPVAGINYRAVPELIKDKKNGFLFDEDDPMNCANAVIECLECNGDIKRNARKTAELYSMESCTKKLIDAYEETLNSHKSR